MPLAAEQNKLECLFLASLIGASPVFASEAKSLSTTVSGCDPKYETDLKKWPGLNTLAYFTLLSATKKKFMTLAPGPNVIKLFLTVIYEFS